MAAAPQRTVVRAGLWRRMDGQGCERFELARGDEGWTLRGTVLIADEAGPAEARYVVTCDAGWRTQRTSVTLLSGDGERSLELAAADGRWLANGTVQEALDGCLDVDLEWSPSTNTLPIRRLGVALGQASGLLRMAWVRFPALTVEPLPQEYRRTAEGRYHYTSGGGTFETDIDVDDQGLVVRYAGGWQRVEPLS